MDLVFERGDASAPRGHALLYFRESGGEGKLYSTYVVVLPIAIDLVKYMPPFLANQLPNVNAQELSAFAFPPMPEEAGGAAQLEALAAARGDDLVFGGDFAAGQVQDMLVRVNDLVQEYAQRYQAHIGDAAAAPEPVAAPEAITGHNVNEVLFELMSERDRLGELAKLTGRLRFAVEGSDARQVQDAEEEVRVLSRYLPERFRIDDLLRAAKDPSRSGGDLAQLYLERCYKLADEDYPSLADIEERIRGLEAG
ncbi:MAG: hypothetical protein OXT51_03030 [Chloroflexota bacterium]|nr:hypothetical protein [Chloroflexota bacterium]